MTDRLKMFVKNLWQPNPNLLNSHSIRLFCKRLADLRKIAIAVKLVLDLKFHIYSVSGQLQSEWFMTNDKSLELNPAAENFKLWPRLHHEWRQKSPLHHREPSGILLQLSWPFLCSLWPCRMGVHAQAFNWKKTF